MKFEFPDVIQDLIETYALDMGFLEEMQIKWKPKSMRVPVISSLLRFPFSLTVEAQVDYLHEELRMIMGLSIAGNPKLWAYAKLLLMHKQRIEMWGEENCSNTWANSIIPRYIANDVLFVFFAWIFEVMRLAKRDVVIFPCLPRLQFIEWSDDPIIQEICNRRLLDIIDLISRLEYPNYVSIM